MIVKEYILSGVEEYTSDVSRLKLGMSDYYYC